MNPRVALIILALLVASSCGCSTRASSPLEAQPVRTNPKALIAFAESVDAFHPVDDRVMGGVSRSAMRRSDSGHALFTGTLSLEHNGGFASVRSCGVELDLSEEDALILRVRGDGKRYKLRLHDDRLDDVSFQSSFGTEAGVWIEVELPLDEFRPVWRGRAVPRAKPLDRSRVAMVGLMISDKQVGEFTLELDWLAASS
ncbi:MAG: CIA30 family protein [Myxococcota bacterium]